MKRKTWIIIIAVIAVITATAVVLSASKNSGIPVLTTQPVTLGSIQTLITATGTVEPVDQVVVGTQVSGVIKKLYVDYNSLVTKGQVLAELDKSTLRAKVLQTQASLAAAENELTYQTLNFNRTKQLWDTAMVSDTEYEAAMYKYNNAKASVDRLASELEQAEVNLSYATIISPINGVVLARNVDEGQTVAASFNTPTLFTIARDLRRMQVEADVDEADIGQVKVGQKAIFTVDAYPDDEFEGLVTQIRLEAKVEANVVTYTVIVETDNPDLKLLPELTASISIIAGEVKDVPVVPAGALYFDPEPSLQAHYHIVEPQQLQTEISQANQDKVQASGLLARSNPPVKPEVVWIKTGNTIRGQVVKTGLNDGVSCEIESGVQPGDTLVLAATVPSGKEELAQGKERSPFMPTPPSRK